MKIIQTKDAGFNVEFRRIKDRGKVMDKGLEGVVRQILEDVALRGDKALFEYTRKFDGVSLTRNTLEVARAEMEEALENLNAKDLDILKTAALRIEDFHRRQMTQSWFYADEKGIELGQLVLPLERVGIYAPGGLACYPSTVLMASIPAKVAGVREIFLVTPVKDGKVDPLILAAARLGGVQRIFKIGGAQAIAALAYGTPSVPPVDKIVGPGNAYVAAAKRMVYGVVGIDMIAGPSEVVIISDGKINPSWVAADLLAQAEHDEMASAILLTPVKSFASDVASEVKIQLEGLARKAIARRSIEDYGVIILTADMDEAFELANRFAPEHLELIVDKPKNFLGRIRNAGAVFLGPETPEVLGDYLAGPNHILPTGGTARFSSPLGFYDFIKRTSVISFTAASLGKYGAMAARFAQMEGLEAHGESITVRLKPKKP
jgi:histidinol dehydrogenase